MNAGYSADPLLRRLTPANGWRHDLISNAHSDVEIVVAVRVARSGPTRWLSPGRTRRWRCATGRITIG